MIESCAQMAQDNHTQSKRIIQKQRQLHEVFAGLFYAILCFVLTNQPVRQCYSSLQQRGWLGPNVTSIVWRWFQDRFFLSSFIVVTTLFVVPTIRSFCIVFFLPHVCWEVSRTGPGWPRVGEPFSLSHAGISKASVCSGREGAIHSYILAVSLTTTQIHSYYDIKENGLEPREQCPPWVFTKTDA